MWDVPSTNRVSLARARARARARVRARAMARTMARARTMAPHRRRPESPVPAGLIKTAESKTGTTVLQKRTGNPVAIPK